MSAPTWTIEQWVEHGRRWLAAGWTWKRGQVALAEDYDGRWRTLVVTGVAANGRPVCYGAPMPSGGVPDLRDPGTRGHALALVREVWGDDGAIALRRVDSDGWLVSIASRVHADEQHVVRWYTICGESRWILAFDGRTEHEALLAAREAAP